MDSEDTTVKVPKLKEGYNLPPNWIVEDNQNDFKVVLPSRSTPGRFYKVLVMKESRECYCECPSYRYRNNCAHVKFLIAISQKPARKRGMQDTQLDSYHQFTEQDLTEMEFHVYDFLKKNGPSTDRALAEKMNWTINRICGRRNKLVEKGMVVDTGKVWDEETKRNVIVWGVA